MKHILLLAFLATSLGCGQDLDACGKTFQTVGLLTKDDKVDGVTYHISIGNTIWSVLLIGLVAPSVYFVGFSIENPIAADCSKIPP